MDSEVLVIKQQLKQKEILVSNIKSECANALLGKEKTTQSKLYQVENEVVDLKYENQKLV
jgi:hypothetical protein